MTLSRTGSKACRASIRPVLPGKEGQSAISRVAKRAKECYCFYFSSAYIWQTSPGRYVPASDNAEVVKLVDTQRSGRCVLMDVGVRVPPSAFFYACYFNSLKSLSIAQCSGCRIGSPDQAKIELACSASNRHIESALRKRRHGRPCWPEGQ